MTKKYRLAALFLAFAAMGATGDVLAAPGYIAYDVQLFSGPSEDYPAIDTLPGDTDITVYGCIDDWNWCDVSSGDERGWVYGDAIDAIYNNQPLALVDAAPMFGIPIITFDINAYWGNHYRGRPFYSDRGRWVNYWHQHPYVAPRGHEARAAAGRSEPAARGEVTRAEAPHANFPGVNHRHAQNLDIHARPETPHTTPRTASSYPHVEHRHHENTAEAHPAPAAHPAAAAPHKAPAPRPAEHGGEQHGERKDDNGGHP